jgi:K+/H+ antiporter YhaU regulatory subunit KhtT
MIAIDKVFHQTGDFALVRLSIGRQADSNEVKIKDTGLDEKGITIFAIERADKVISSPGVEEKLAAGDYLLCYGSITQITEMSGRIVAA